MVAVLSTGSAGGLATLPPTASLCVIRSTVGDTIQQYHITNNGKLATTHGLRYEDTLSEGDIVLYLGVVTSPAYRGKLPSQKWHVIAVLTADGRKLMISRNDVELVPV